MMTKLIELSEMIRYYFDDAKHNGLISMSKYDAITQIKDLTTIDAKNYFGEPKVINQIMYAKGYNVTKSFMNYIADNEIYSAEYILSKNNNYVVARYVIDKNRDIIYVYNDTYSEVYCVEYKV